MRLDTSKFVTASISSFFGDLEATTDEEFVNENGQVVALGHLVNMYGRMRPSRAPSRSNSKRGSSVYIYFLTNLSKECWGLTPRGEV